jgi:hypothetical protein
MVICRASLFATAAGSNGPAPRCHHGICCNGGKLYVVGGEDGEGVFDDVWALDMSTGHWQEIEPVNPHDFSGRQGCTCCVIDDKLFVIGGGDLLSHHIGAVLDLQSLVWTDLALHGVLGHRPDARQHHACAVVAGGVVVHGGFNGVQHLGDTWLLDAKTLAWRQLHKAGPAPPCSNHCLLNLDDFSLLRIGGEASSHASTVLAPPLIIDLRHDGAWREQPITGAPPAPLSDCSAGYLATADGARRLCMFGGWGDGAAASRCVVVDTQAWTAAEAAVKSAAHVEVNRLGAGALQQSGGDVLLFGGWDGMFQWANTLLSIKLF